MVKLFIWNLRMGLSNLELSSWHSEAKLSLCFSLFFHTFSKYLSAVTGVCRSVFISKRWSFSVGCWKGGLKKLLISLISLNHFYLSLLLVTSIPYDLLHYFSYLQILGDHLLSHTKGLPVLLMDKAPFTNVSITSGLLYLRLVNSKE